VREGCSVHFVALFFVMHNSDWWYPTIVFA